ncbi:MAG: HD domain-containing phosphohydrolase [Solirubrobacterales bacterium]
MDETELSPATLVEARGATLLEALERHLSGSRDHADGTASYAFAAAAGLGIGRAHAEAVRATARLHEVGKVYLPPALLTKDRSALSPQEAALVDSHWAYGAALARGAGVPDAPCEWIGACGQPFDGGGVGLAGGLPLEARIVRVACECDALIASGPAGQPAHRAAIAGLRASAGVELDPAVVESLAEILERAA